MHLQGVAPVVAEKQVAQFVLARAYQDFL